MTVHEALMPSTLHALQRDYLNLPHHPRIKIIPTYDARPHNLRERAAHRPGWRERIFTLPPGLHRQVIGLRS